MRGKLGEHGLELRFEQLEPRDLAVAKVSGAIELLGLVEPRFLDRVPQRPACGRPQVRKEKPRVSAFISADVPKILALKPDLVLTFSDLQANIVADLVRANVAVHAFNQRDVAGILDMIRTLGALVGASEKAEALARSLAAHVDAVHERSLSLPRRPRVYFEEWDEPMISGIAWVSELIEAAGGIDVFPHLAARKNAKDRIVSPGEVIAARPDVIVG